MKFIYHHRTQGRGGEGLHIASLIRALEAAGHELTLVSPPGVDPLQTAGAVPVDKGMTKERGIHQLWKWISRHSPQIVFEVLELCYNLYAAVRLLPMLQRYPTAVYYERYAFFLFVGVMIARWYRRPVLLEVNEVVGLKRARGQVLGFLARWLERAIFRRADAILTVSSLLQKEVLQRGAREGIVHVIPNAVDPQWFEHNGCGMRLRQECGLTDATVVGFVGWFDFWDRLDLLVDVVQKLRNLYPTLRLLLVGDGPVTPTLQAKIRQHHLESTVILTGPVPRTQVPDYIDAMDICVLPDSNSFGSPIVLFEFMAGGKAVIAPDLSPIRDVVEDHVTGLIVQPGDPESLQQALTRLLDDTFLRLRLGQQARQYVMAYHTWNANGHRVAALANAIVTQHEHTVNLVAHSNV
jgi:glycosyltransferase involved in cell wall biosynthesis